MTDGENYDKLFDKIVDSSSCPNCQYLLLKDNAFCAKCGDANSNFDEKNYEKIVGETHVEAVKRSCIELEHAGHLSDSLGSKEATEFYRENSFCSDCGKKIKLPE